MLNIIKKIENNLAEALMKHIYDNNIIVLLEECDVINNKRIELTKQKKYNEEINILLNNI